jgi:hypothetical protein
MKCPECGGRVYAYYPFDGGPERPRWECYDCYWSEPIGPED